MLNHMAGVLGTSIPFKCCLPRNPYDLAIAPRSCASCLSLLHATSSHASLKVGFEKKP